MYLCMHDLHCERLRLMYFHWQLCTWSGECGSYTRRKHINIGLFHHHQSEYCRVFPIQSGTSCRGEMLDPHTHRLTVVKVSGTPLNCLIYCTYTNKVLTFEQVITSFLFYYMCMTKTKREIMARWSSWSTTETVAKNRNKWPSCAEKVKDKD